MQDRNLKLEAAKAGRIKKAELLGSVGALVVGVGLGLLFTNFLKPYTVPALLIGLLMHGWGMFDKHRLERSSSDVRIWWQEFLYWFCWITLFALILYIAVSYSRR